MIGRDKKKMIHTNKVLTLLLCVFCFFVISPAQAQTNKELFDKANELYRVNKYSEAISIYESIESKGMVSSELYYNLGNAYYKLNKIAPSIYNYEKALKINPQNEDARANLVFSKRMSIDSIEELPKTVLQKLEANYIQKLSYNQWAWLAVILSTLTGLFFLLFYFSHIPSRKRIFFVTSVLSALFLIVSLLFTFKEYTTSTSTIEAIIFAEKAPIKNAPTNNSEAIFELHEGTKVFVLDSVDTWKKIKLADGKTGWIAMESLKEL